LWVILWKSKIQKMILTKSFGHNMIRDIEQKDI